MRINFGAMVMIGATLGVMSHHARAEVPPPPELERIRIEEKLGAPVPLDAMFTDSDGQQVTLGALLKPGRPTIVTLGYFECPMLCDIVLNGLVGGMKGVVFSPGVDFEVISISIEPRETPELAALKKANYLKSYGKPMPPSGWHFLTGSAESSKRVAQAVGWNYFWDDKIKQYAHAAGIFVLTPAGTVSRVLYGIEYQPKDLRLALVEAGQGKLGSAVDKLLLWCYHYDAEGRRYSLYAMNLMRLAGALTVVAIAVFVSLLLSADKRRQRMALASAGSLNAGAEAAGRQGAKV